VSIADWPHFEPQRILGLLTARGVDFVLIGGYAAVLHGSPRVTRDLDICYATDRENLRAIAKVLEELNARPFGADEDVPFVADERTLAKVDLLTLETDAGRLDLLTAPAGSQGYNQLRANAAHYEIGGFLVKVAEIEDLLAMKAAAGRPKDLADIAELETIAALRSRSGR
jgi:predicted nucleotidyltransferase